MLDWRSIPVGKIAFVATCATLFVFLLDYLSTSTPAYLKWDNWRHLEVYLVPWYEGRFEFSDLWANHHPNPAAAMMFIFNAEVFGLRLDIEACVGWVLRAIAVAILVMHAGRNRVGARRERIDWNDPILLVILLSAFSLQSDRLYSLPLLAFNNSSSFLVLVVMACSYDEYCGSRSFPEAREAAISLRRVVLLIALIALTSVTNNALILMSIASMSALLAAARGERGDVRALAGFTLLAVAYLLLGRSIESVNPLRRDPSFVDVLMQDPLGMFEKYAMALFSSLTQTTRLGEIGVADSWVPILSYLFALFYLGSIAVFFRQKMWKKTTIPMILILYHVLHMTTTFVVRLPPTTWLAYMPRYVPTYKIGLLGVLWIYLDWMQVVGYRRVAGVAVAFLLLVEVERGLHLNSFARRNAVRIEVIENAIYQSGVDNRLHFDATRASGPVTLEKIQFLKRHRLNVFHYLER